MNGYSQAISVLSSRLSGRQIETSQTQPTEVSLLAVWLLPNFLTAVLVVTLLQVLFLSAGSPRLFHDSDTGWHVRNGESIVANASVPSKDDFSYTRAGEAWFSWEWLSDVALGTLHRLAGLPAIALTAAVVIAFTAVGSAQLALSLGGNLFLTAGATVVLLGVTSMHWLARPHLFSWILALVFLSVAEHERRQPTRTLYALPVVSILWTNMHGSFLLGPTILFVYALGEWVTQRNEEGNLFTSRYRFALTGLLSLLGTFINPYGWRLHQHIFSYLRNTYLMDHIQEFRSFDFHSSGALYVELFFATAVAGMIALARQRAYGPALLSLGMLHASLYSARHLPTAAVLLLPLSVAALTREAKRLPRLQGFIEYSDRLRAIDRQIYGVIPIALVLVFTLFGLNAHATAGHVGFDSGPFPVQAADFLETNDPERNGYVFATDQWGGYLIYRFAGRMKVFVDGRSDFYGQNLLEKYAQVTELKPGWESILKQYKVRFVLVPAGHALASALQLSSQWKQVYEDAVAVVYERRG